MSGIYIHVPFCRQACSYCDFYFVTRQEMRDDYVDGVMKEIAEYKDTPYAQEPVETIYFGGGTPSRLRGGQIEAILLALDEVFTLQPREITLEMNPDDVTASYLKDLHAAGINRASMGVQSFQPELLTAMNRAHTREEARRCLGLLRASPVEAFTVDLIYGNPGQTTEQLENDLDQLLLYQPPHVSTYALTVEPRTRLGKQVELGRIMPPADEHVAHQFSFIAERLAGAGLHRYEVSNYSKPGREALHNSHYWEHENYLGFGPAAHSFWWEGTGPAQRWKNEADLQAYLQQKAPPHTGEKLSYRQLAEERLMMGLRTRKGIAPATLRSKYTYELNDRQQEYLHQQQEKGHLRWDEHISLQQDGLIIADAIILDIITLHEG